MAQNIQLSITRKIWAGVILASSAITIFVTLLQLYHDFRSQVDIVTGKFDIIHSTTSSGLSQALWDLNHSQLEEQLKGSLNFPIIDRVELHYESLEGKSQLQFGSSGESPLSQSYPLENDGEFLGEITYYSKIERIYSHLWEELFFILLIQSAKTFLASFLIMWIISKIVTKHLIDISEYLERQDILTLSKSDLIDIKRPSCIEKRRDELHQLTDNINQMMVDLHDYRTQMDQLVAQKTSDLEHALKIKGDFLANMSHELRTPMNGILATSKLLLENEQLDDKEELLELIYSSANNLIYLINDLLDYSKLESGNIQLENIPFNLKNVTDKVLQLLQVMAHNKGLCLNLRWPEELPSLWIGDPLRIQQILTNIVGNAIKFTAKGEINLWTQKSDQGLSLYIQDTGIGIAEEQLELIFEQFSQADSSTTRTYGGSGLGLSISKQLCELMHGKISVSSELGVGSTFQIDLPLLPVHQTPEAKTPEVSRSDSSGRSRSSEKLESNSRSDEEEAIDRPNDREAIGQRVTAKQSQNTSDKPFPYRVLLAEDNPINQKVAKLLLKKLGFTIDICANGEEVVQSYQHEQYDLIILDIQMPIMDGFQALEKLRSQPCSIPIIAMTANVYENDEQTFIDAGFDAYIPKPLVIENIVNTLERFLEKHNR